MRGLGEKRCERVTVRRKGTGGKEGGPGCRIGGREDRRSNSDAPWTENLQNKERGWASRLKDRSEERRHMKRLPFTGTV